MIDLINAVNNEYRPNMIVAAGNGGEEIPLLAQRRQVNGKATAYVCRRFVCKQPVTSGAQQGLKPGVFIYIKQFLSVYIRLIR